MSALGTKLRVLEGGAYSFWCPGCQRGHMVHVDSVNSVGAKWTFNGNGDAPTFSPSIHLQVEYGDGHRETRCHSFITDGMIQFLGDCTHALAGQTVPLPDWGVK